MIPSNDDVAPAIPVNNHALLDWKPPSKVVVELGDRLLSVNCAGSCSSWQARRSRSCTTSSSRISRILGRPRLAFPDGEPPHGVDVVLGDVVHDVGGSHIRSLGTRRLERCVLCSSSAVRRRRSSGTTTLRSSQQVSVEERLQVAAAASGDDDLGSSAGG